MIFIFLLRNFNKSRHTDRLSKNCHPRADGDPALRQNLVIYWIPAYAGMTNSFVAQFLDSLEGSRQVGIFEKPLGFLTPFGKTTEPRGQSFLEVILALGVFSIMTGVLVAMITGGFSLIDQSNQYTQAQAKADAAIELARASHQDAWNSIPTATSTSEQIGAYTATTSYSPVCRNSAHELAHCPASYTDVQSKQVTVTVSWETGRGGVNSIARIAYLTNWNSRDWQQTDWSGGAGQTLWVDSTRFNFADSINATSTPGALQLVDAPDGSWSLSGGGSFTDTKDIDFNQGGFFGTTVTGGAGNESRIALAKNFQWALHQDSASTTTRDINAFSALSPTDIWAAADTGELLHFNGLEWTVHTDVGSAHVRGLSILTSQEGFAVGQSGKIYRFNGSVWSEHADTGDHVWQDVVALGSNDIWAVGSVTSDEEDGRIAHYDGTAWTVTLPPSSHSINAIVSINTSDLWAVGKSGRIWHFDGGAWSLHTDTGGETWNDVVMLSSNNGWAVGNNGALAKWNGASWVESSVPSGEDIRGASALSTSDIWACGKSGSVWHYDGITWILNTDMGDQTWNDCIIIGPGNGFIGGNAGRIGAYGLFSDSSGTYVSRVFDSADSNTIWSIATWVEELPSGGELTVATRAGNSINPDDGSWSSWSNELTNPFGSTISSPSPRRFVQYRLTLTRGIYPTQTPRLNSITIVYNLATTQNLNGMYASSSDDIWAAGASGKIVRYNGSSWIEFTDTGGETWNDIAMTSASNGWAVGNGGSLAQWNGFSWSESSLPSSADAHALFAFSSQDIWVAGSNGRIWHFDGSSWTLQTDTGDEIWNDISFSSLTNGWAVGNNGALAKWDGTSWVESIISPSANIHSIAIVSPSDMWACGSEGRIWRFNGLAWSLHTDTGDHTWNDIAFANASDGWAAGNNGALRRWKGTNWDEHQSPTSQQLKALALISAKLGWAAGTSGTIIQFYREALYPVLGSLESSAFSLGKPSSVPAIEWSQTNSNCVSSCFARFQIRGAPDASGSPGIWSAWQGASGNSTYFTIAQGSLVPVIINNSQWIQYRMELGSDGTSTPIISDVKVNYR